MGLLNSFIILAPVSLLIGSLSVSVSVSITYAQPAEDPEHNLKGKLAMIQDVMDICGEKVEIGGPVWDAVEADCLKVISATNSNLSKILIDNKESIDNILYGGRVSLKTLGQLIELTRTFSYTTFL